jgi:hypothetical protein
MPMANKEDFGCGDEKALTCVHCTNVDGTVKSCEEIFEGGVQFFMGVTSVSRFDAEKFTRKNMRSLSYWKNKKCSCLDGEVATDKEFGEAMERL